jgi:hypothetical protein
MPNETPHSVTADVVCHVAETECNVAVNVAVDFLGDRQSDAPTRMVVNPGRALPGVIHAEVYACFAGGRYLLVDVIGRTGADATASLRQDFVSADPPCR